MRKREILFSFLILFSFVGFSEAQTNWQVLGPVTCKRSTGDPISENFSFSAIGGQATITVINGNLEDSSVERVSSSIITLNGISVCGPDDFNQKLASFQKSISLHQGHNQLQVLLKGKPGGQLTIKITQEVATVTPQLSILETANALRIGNVTSALKGFYPDVKRSTLLSTFNSEELIELANFFENAILIDETENMQSYRYTWNDENGENFCDFYLVKNSDDKWIIKNW